MADGGLKDKLLFNPAGALAFIPFPRRLKLRSAQPATNC